MAVYQRFTSSTGASIALDDACFASKTPAELRAAYAEMNRVAREICIDAALRAQKEKQTKEAQTHAGMDTGAV